MEEKLDFVSQQTGWTARQKNDRKKNNGLHHPKGQTDRKWNDDSPSSLLLSHSAIPFAAPFFGYPSDCISSGQISAFTLQPLLPPPLLRRPTSVQWQGLLHLLGAAGVEYRQSVGCTESEGGGTEDEERGVKTKPEVNFNTTL